MTMPLPDDGPDMVGPFSRRPWENICRETKLEEGRLAREERRKAVDVAAKREDNKFLARKAGWEPITVGERLAYIHPWTGTTSARRTSARAGSSQHRAPLVHNLEVEDRAAGEQRFEGENRKNPRE